MAKRAPVDEKPYRPLQASLVRAVANRRPVQEVRATPEIVRAHIESTGSTEVPVHSPNEAPSPHHDLATRKRREKRVLLTIAEEQAFEALVARLALALGTPLKSSHVLRASIAVLVRAEESLIREAQNISPLTRPPNGSAQALGAFEREIAGIIVRAIKSS